MNRWRCPWQAGSPSGGRRPGPHGSRPLQWRRAAPASRQRVAAVPLRSTRVCRGWHPPCCPHNGREIACPVWALRITASVHLRRTRICQRGEPCSGDHPPCLSPRAHLLPVGVLCPTPVLLWPRRRPVLLWRSPTLPPSYGVSPAPRGPCYATLRLALGHASEAAARRWAGRAVGAA